MSTRAQMHRYTNAFYFLRFAPFLLVFAFYDALTTFKCRIGTKFDCRNKDAHIPCWSDFQKSQKYFEKHAMISQLERAIPPHEHLDTCCYTKIIGKPFFILKYLLAFLLHNRLIIPMLQPFSISLSFLISRTSIFLSSIHHFLYHFQFIFTFCQFSFWIKPVTSFSTLTLPRFHFP